MTKQTNKQTEKGHEELKESMRSWICSYFLLGQPMPTDKAFERHIFFLKLIYYNSSWRGFMMLKMKNVFYRELSLNALSREVWGGTQQERRDKDKILGKGSH